MKQAIHVRVDNDPEVGPLTYIEYVEGVAKSTRRVNESIATDYDDAGTLMGIELLDLDADTVEMARRVAADHDVAFPTFLNAPAFS